MADNWLKITISGQPELMESLGDFIIGVLGGAVEMAGKAEPGYGTVNCYLEQASPTPEEVTDIVTRLTEHLRELEAIFSAVDSTITWEMIGNQDWGKEWKKHFKPFAIVPGLVIVPTWEVYTPAEDELVLTMDPGMVFGTGHHATTALSLDYIRQSLAKKPGATMLDVGTGTGLLGMGGLLLGASAVIAIDNDPDAVSAAGENVQLNNMEQRMQVEITPLREITALFDLVVANIVHDVLVEMAEDLCDRVVPGGCLILSGIITEEQLDNIRTIFSGKGMVATGDRQRGEWSAIRFEKMQ